MSRELAVSRLYKRRLNIVDGGKAVVLHYGIEESDWRGGRGGLGGGVRNTRDVRLVRGKRRRLTLVGVLGGGKVGKLRRLVWGLGEGA